MDKSSQSFKKLSMHINQYLRYSFSIWFLLVLVSCSSNDVKVEPTPLASFDEQYEFDKIWSRDIGSDFEDGYWLLKPVIDEQAGIIFAADQQGTITALSLEDGERIWSIDIDQEIIAGLSQSQGKLFLGLGSGILLCIDQETGEEIWQRQLTSELAAPVDILSRYVVAMTLDGHIKALDIEQGDIIWNFQSTVPILSLRGAASPVIVSDRVFVALDNGQMVSLSLESGQLLWQRQIGVIEGRNEFDRLNDLDAAIKFQEGVIFTASYQSRIAAVSPLDGQLVWSKKISTFTPFVMHRNQAFVAEDTGQITSVDLSNSESVWQQSGLVARWPSGLSFIRVGSNDLLLTTDFDGYLHALQLDTGEFAGRARLGSAPIRVPPIVVDQNIYVLSSNAQLAKYEMIQSD